ncbi:MAG TPA: beta-ketoacyl-[acyl-carrier-protein] synthase family protein [Gemmataceae bacterium]|nr:beta-ketoacyl-[acyl-carrier-protein] synthase family protein [Gemmataceae bacterium]
MTSSRRAVLTGVGVLTPIGLDAASFRRSLHESSGGVHAVRSFDASALPVRFGGEIVGFDARNYLEKKERKRLNVMVRTIQFAVAAAQMARADAGLEEDRIDPTRFGVVFGAGTIPGDLADLGPASRLSLVQPARMNAAAGRIDLKKWGEGGIPAIPPMWMLNHVPNMLACHVSILHNAQGPNNTICQTDVGGLLALGEALRAVQRGRADLFLAGGADAKINPITMARQSLFTVLSRRNDAPEQACRPFDRGRDGVVLGEGSGVLVLEELEHARRRGARIYAEVIGFGAAFDHGLTGAGMIRAMRAALGEAAIGPDDLDHVNAQGCSAMRADAVEARALRELFGPACLVFAAKSYFGNAGPASGPMELAASVLAGADGVLPATLNYEEPDPQCPVRVLREPRPVKRLCFLKLSFTERGQCAAVVIRRWE